MQEKIAQTKLEDFQKIKYLGRGSFGEVHLVKNIQISYTDTIPETIDKDV
jgi:serine/threonine protein kinase